MTRARVWQYVTLRRGERTVKAAELRAYPGTCAACRGPFDLHGDEELAACAATYEETLPTGDEA